MGSTAGGPMHVAVVGPGTADPELEEVAFEVGRRLGERGAVVVGGGLGGVMAAACRGAGETGGRTVGILPGHDRGAANPHVETAIPTGLGEARNTLVVRAADAIIAVGGGYGTLSEIAFALKTDVPVVGVGTWELTRGDGTRDDGIVVVDDAASAVDTALRLAGRSDRAETAP
jgi:uncharacterized protein (TIGR00725 family)